MRMSESWQNVNDPFNNLETEWNNWNTTVFENVN